ncbi:SAR2788 family putative toxin [Rossellomorea arthrocnemi]
MKHFIRMIVVMVLLAAVLPNFASAQENAEVTANEIVKYNSLSEPIGAKGDQLEVTGEEHLDSVNIDVNLTALEEQFNAKMVLSTEENKDHIVYISKIDEEGNTSEEKYILEIIELDEEVVKAKLIDSSTLEETIIDSSEVQATIIPVIVALIVRAGLQYAIKHYGKKLAMQAMIDIGVSQITKAYGGSVKGAKNGKGKVITISNKNQPIVIRLMEAGSGGRKDAYWRMSVGNKSLNRAGNYSSNKSETHITLKESSPATILKLIKKFKK